MVIWWKEKICMKIGRWIGLGIFLSIVGVGITAVASTQVDFNQEIKKYL